jgi:hypothetical protein
MRTTTQSSYFFSEPQPAVRLEVSSYGNTDEVVVNSQFESTDGFDAFIDAKKLLNTTTTPQIQAFTMSSDNMPLAINSLGQINNQIVPLQIVAANAGEVSIKLNVKELGTQYSELYLEDASTGKLVDLKRNEIYSTTVSQGNSGSRFFLHFSKPSEVKSMSETKIYAVSNTIFTNLSIEANGTLELVDLFGKTVYSSNFSGKSGRVAFEIPTLANGTYIVKLVENGKITNQKVVINQ